MTDEREAPPKRKARAPSRNGKTDPEQYERFLEAARELGCEESPEQIDEVLRRMTKMPPQRREPAKAGKGKKAGS